MSPAEEQAELQDASLLLRWAASALTEPERLSVAAFTLGWTQAEAAQQIGITRGGVFMAQQRALRKMRRRLYTVGIHSAADICSRLV